MTSATLRKAMAALDAAWTPPQTHPCQQCGSVTPFDALQPVFDAGQGRVFCQACAAGKQCKESTLETLRKRISKE